MSARFIGSKAYYTIHFLCLCMLALGLPWSKFLMSCGTIFGITNLVFFGWTKENFSELKKHRGFIILLAFYLLHIIALLWSNDLDYGLNDIRRKLPLLLIPLLFLAGPTLKANHIWNLLWVFVGTTIVCSIINFCTYDAQLDIRYLSKFGSHIRFALMIISSATIILVCGRHWPKYKFMAYLLVAWLLFYTYYSQVFSGLLAILFVLWGYILYLLWNKAFWRFGLLSLPVIGFVAGLIFIESIKPIEPKTLHSNLEWNSKEGSPYFHNLEDHTTENGYYVMRYISDEEINREWPSRSSMHLDSTKFDGWSLRTVLYRYLSSKGLKKDAQGLSELSEEDIKNIEKGFPNAQSAKTGFISRLATIRYQLENQSNPNASSLLQRLAYWKASLTIIAENPIWGVGTGDVSDAFKGYYDKIDSPLEEKYRLRGHNQFLTTWLSFGLIGISIFLLLIYQLYNTARRNSHLLGFLILSIIVGSFFLEDTIETQAGITFTAFFIAYLLHQSRKTNPEAAN